MLSSPRASTHTPLSLDVCFPFPTCFSTWLAFTSGDPITSPFPDCFPACPGVSAGCDALVASQGWTTSYASLSLEPSAWGSVEQHIPMQEADSNPERDSMGCWSSTETSCPALSLRLSSCQQNSGKNPWW